MEALKVVYNNIASAVIAHIIKAPHIESLTTMNACGPDRNIKDG